MDVLRYAAFTRDPDGGNPAGVVLDARGEPDRSLQQVATEVGYSETAFLLPQPEPQRFAVRYFSPLAEVPFCGHATIATGVAHAERHGPGTLLLATAAGPVEVVTSITDGVASARLTSVPPHTEPTDDDVLAALLGALRWAPTDLDPALPVRVAYAGARHPVVAAATRERLAQLDYDVPALGALMAEQGWTTVQLVRRRSPTEFVARNPFPPGGVYEDPATGAAAAALGGYLRELGLIAPPVRLRIRQGEELGRPGLLVVDVPAGADTGIQVSGTAVPIPA
jgi:PhzF family phenazine biosynthesis protein